MVSQAIMPKDALAIGSPFCCINHKKVVQDLKVGSAMRLKQVSRYLPGSNIFIDISVCQDVQKLETRKVSVCLSVCLFVQTTSLVPVSVSLRLTAKQIFRQLQIRPSIEIVLSSRIRRSSVSMMSVT